MKSDIDKIIKSYEPMMHKLVRKFKIKRDYEDIVQLLRIKTWEVLRDKKYKKDYKNDKGQIVDAKLSTLLYKILLNRLMDILRTEYGMRIKEDGTRFEEPTINQKTTYFLKNPILYGIPFLQVENYDTEDKLKCQLDFENYLKSLSNENRELLLLMQNTNGNKKEVSKVLKCSSRTLNRRLAYLKNKYKKYITGGV
jgi:RNA polymerase sigma factor (sigma-70 family)